MRCWDRRYSQRDFGTASAPGTIAIPVPSCASLHFISWFHIMSYHHCHFINHCHHYIAHYHYVYYFHIFSLLSFHSSYFCEFVRRAYCASHVHPTSVLPLDAIDHSAAERLIGTHGHAHTCIGVIGLPMGLDPTKVSDVWKIHLGMVPRHTKIGAHYTDW